MHASPPPCMTVCFAYSTRTFLSQHIYLITYAKNTGIVNLSLPPYCPHHQQPMGVSFYAPYATCYARYKCHQGSITVHHISATKGSITVHHISATKEALQCTI